MYMNGTFKPQVKISSKAYVVLCYGKTKRGWFTQDDYKKFQLNRPEFIKDIARNFKQLSRYGYLAEHEDENETRYRITADGETCLRHIGRKRVEDYEQALVDNAHMQNKKRSQINLNETPLTSN